MTLPLTPEQLDQAERERGIPALSLDCTTAQYAAASLQQQQDYNRRLLASWGDNAAAIESKDNELDQYLHHLNREWIKG